MSYDTTDVSTTGLPRPMAVALNNGQIALAFNDRITDETTATPDIVFGVLRKIHSVLPIALPAAEPQQVGGIKVAVQAKFSLVGIAIDVFRESEFVDPQFLTNVIGMAQAADDEWFRAAMRLNDSGESARALDAVFDKVDDWLCAGQFCECDAFLGRLEVESTPSRLLLAILTVTLPASEKLSNREAVFSRAWKTMADRGKDVRRLLGRLRAPHGATPKRSPNVRRPSRIN